MASKRKSVIPKKTPTVMGRPVVFDEERLRQLGELMRLNPTLEDTAAFFECGATTVEDTIRKHYDITFREFREQRMVHTRLRLVRNLVNEADKGNITAMIFALKNLNGWSDKVKNEHSGPDGAPIPLKAVSELTDEELQQRLADYRAKGII